jgi:O-antigen ligase
VWIVDRRSLYAWAIFVVWGVVVSLAAQDPFYTWFGTPDRHLGLLAWILFAVLFFAGQSIAATDGPGFLLRAAVVAGALVAAVSLLEWMGTPVVELTDSSSRLGGPFGSPAYLGAALCLLIPLTVSMAADSSVTKAWRSTGRLTTVALLAVAIGTQTRATWFGLAVAAAVTFGAWRSWFSRRRILATTAGLVLAATLAISPFADRVAATVTDGAAQGRLDEWSTGVSAIVEHPLLGTGFEGYRIVFPSVVDAEYERRYGRSVIPDRAHNGALDVGITTGLGGITLYLVGAIWLVIRSRRAISTNEIAQVGLGAAIIAYIAQQQFLFPIVEVDPVFWLAAGVLIASTQSNQPLVPALSSMRIAASDSRRRCAVRMRLRM